MLMNHGERWHCTNRLCHCEVLVETSGKVQGLNPVCACGAAMKKKYAAPALNYLEFLRADAIVSNHSADARED
jgi:hypothetical protein